MCPDMIWGVELLTCVIGKSIVNNISANKLLRLVSIIVRRVIGPSDEISCATIMTTAGDVAVAIVAANADGNHGNLNRYKTVNTKLKVRQDSKIAMGNNPRSCRNQLKSRCLPKSNKMRHKAMSTKKLASASTDGVAILNPLGPTKNPTAI